ncbi:MAG: hypothetical protein ACM31C_25695 [Acidobacteriota bacterium]
MTKLALLLVLVSAAGCKKAADLSKYKDKATALAAKYSPKLADLSKKLPDLAAHAKDLPVNVPGADQLTKLLADNKSTLDSAQDVLAKLPDKLKTDTPEQAEKDLAEADKVLAQDVQTAEKDEQEEAADEAKLAAGSGSAAK